MPALIKLMEIAQYICQVGQLEKPHFIREVFDEFLNWCLREKFTLMNEIHVGGFTHAPETAT
jgi:hypothetical protein